MKTFEQMAIMPALKFILNELEYTTPTPIQEQVIPVILEGNDVVAKAPTGTGKTFAFSLPILTDIDKDSTNVEVLILCPTRELVLQTTNEIRSLLKYIEGIRVLPIYGGEHIARQLSGLKKRPQIIIGTPGRVIDHLSRKTIRLENLKTLVLDEADEMLNMGFREDLDRILYTAPTNRQTLLFSATMSREILDISRNYQNNPVEITATIEKSELPVIDQYYIKVKDKDKFAQLVHLIQKEDIKLCLVFTNTKRRADELSRKLNIEGMNSDALHGDLRQKIRDKIMQKYRQGELEILVATDIAARGIDVDNIQMVFNYDVPQNTEYYIHRIGRTARAGKTGVAYTFVNEQQLGEIKQLEKFTAQKLTEVKGLVEFDTSVFMPRKLDRPNSNCTRYFINIGKKDGDYKEIYDFIISTTNLAFEQIIELKLLDKYGFLEVSNDTEQKALALNDNTFKKRKINIELSEPKNNTQNKSLSANWEKKKQFVSKNNGKSASKKDSRFTSTDRTVDRADKNRFANSDKPASRGEKNRFTSADRTADRADKNRFANSDKPASRGEKNRFTSTDKTVDRADKNRFANSDKPASRGEKNRFTSTDRTADRADKNRFANAENPYKKKSVKPRKSTDKLFDGSKHKSKSSTVKNGKKSAQKISGKKVVKTSKFKI